MRKIAVLSSLVFILLLMLPSILSTEAALTWNIQTVDRYAGSSGYGTAYPIAIDSKNVIHIAYSSFGDSWSAVYTSWNGSGWNTQGLAQNALVQCLALDANDNPHIVYLNRNSGYFNYASWTGSNWSTQNTGIKDGYYFALAFDTSGNPHMAYTSAYSAEGYMINYASLTGTRWDSNRVDISEGREVSFALDSNNKPYILYSPSSYADSNMTVGIRAETTRLAAYQNSAWNIETLSLPPPTGKIGTMVIDSKDNPHFICTQHHFVSEEDKTILSSILYASLDGNSWKTQTVASDLELLSIGQLVLDKNDNPRLTYLTPAADGETASYYACWTGNAWGIQRINTGSGETASGSLALDADGNPHITSLGRSAMRYTAPLLYANGTGTIDALPLENLNGYILITITVALIFVTIAVVVFVWKKKSSPKTLK